MVVLDQKWVASSSLSLEDSVGLALEISSDLASRGVSLGRLRVDLIKAKLLLFLSFKEVNFDSVVTKGKREVRYEL